ncbi:o-succinylbenzoate--CoA ligase [Cellulomonas sp. P22]|uniref:o-succinylbenzoate--CoA ligase n=1 Tax=Cellulomonas sp. P22 TaxID=3373189 RepID=UPI00378E5598
MSRAVHEVLSSASTVPELTAAIARALDGTGPAVLPVAPDLGLPDPGAATTVPDEVALVVRTSGSTGTPRGVLLGAAALRASGSATEARVGGPGRWLLALPTAHVAGLQVLVRSVLAGTSPVVLDPGPFRPEAFAAAADLLTDAPRRLTSLVPTQLHRLLGSPAGTRALATFDAVLLGGAAASPALVAEARAAGVRVVTTYGMSETCGGCVYDGVPLDGVRVDLDEDGRVLLAGPVLAAGYLDRPDLDAETFTRRDGVRWLRTSDLGELVPDDAAPGGVRLRVLGRLDDVVVTGGAKVAPAAVERALHDVPGVGEVCVVGVPDPEWGQALTAVVVPRPGTAAPTLADVRDAARTLGAASAPRHLVLVDALPVRGPGKTDRQAVMALATARLAADG